MKILDKVLSFFTYEEENENYIEKEKLSLKKELMEERKKYAKKEIEEPVVTEEVLEPVKKQVMFVDEAFKREEKVKVQEPQPTNPAPKYTDANEKKFKPSSYISPVHGLLKKADEVEEYKSEVKTKSESDYSKIRDKAFGSSTEEIEEDSKFFETSEIVDLQKRMQVDGEKSLDKNLTIDEACERAQTDGEVINNKTFTEPEENPQYVFDLLDELKEDSNE